MAAHERDRLKALGREVRDQRRVNEILRKASAYLAAAELDRLTYGCTRSPTRIANAYGDELICPVWRVESSGDYTRRPPGELAPPAVGAAQVASREDVWCVRSHLAN